ncbi:MAG: hypothetical protein KAH99_00470 [Verrucomicrobia bacterium]|nr:hypothetical protein [Verrucomicrobiota bacterium]
MNLSKFGEKLTRKAGITALMDDLGAAMEGADMLMLGGGNPAHIPEVQDRFRKRILAAQARRHPRHLRPRRSRCAQRRQGDCRRSVHAL